MKKSELRQMIREEFNLIINKRLHEEDSSAFFDRINKNKPLKVGDTPTISRGKYKGKKAKITKDLGNGKFEFELLHEEVKRIIEVDNHKPADLRRKIPGVDKISKLRNGNFKGYWGFFYSSGQTAEQKENLVKKAYPEAKIIDSGQNWVAFKGGASVEKQSHFWVEFTL